MYSLCVCLRVFYIYFFFCWRERIVVYYLIFQPNGILNCFFLLFFPPFFLLLLLSMKRERGVFILYAWRRCRRRDVTCRSDALRYILNNNNNTRMYSLSLSPLDFSPFSLSNTTLHCNYIIHTERERNVINRRDFNPEMRKKKRGKEGK